MGELQEMLVQPPAAAPGLSPPALVQLLVQLRFSPRLQVAQQRGMPALAAAMGPVVQKTKGFLHWTLLLLLLQRTALPSWRCQRQSVPGVLLLQLPLRLCSVLHVWWNCHPRRKWRTRRLSETAVPGSSPKFALPK